MKTLNLSNTTPSGAAYMAVVIGFWLGYWAGNTPEEKIPDIVIFVVIFATIPLATVICAAIFVGLTSLLIRGKRDQ